MSDSDRNALSNAIASVSPYSCGFLMMDLNTGKGVAYNADTVYYSASSIKGPYITSLVANIPGTLDYEAGHFAAVANWSSNDDYAYIRSKYGTGYMNQWNSSARVADFQWAGYYGFYSPWSLAKMWIKSDRFFHNGTTAGQRTGNLFTTPATSAIRETLGSKYQTQSKAGWYPSDGIYTASADGGIVYASNGSYVVAVMSNVPGNVSRLDGIVRTLDNIHDKM